jgi:DNA-binding Lrp family transcriptional regulator
MILTYRIVGGRKMTKEISEEDLLALLERGFSPPEIAKEVGVTPPTIRQRIAKMQQDQGVLLQYRQLQNLRLTELQHAILEAITPEKIAEAPLNVLVQAFRILKDKELVMTGNPTEIKGLVGYLVQLEKQELAATQHVDAEDIIDVTPPSNLPRLQ